MSKASDLRAKDVAGLEKEVGELLRAHFNLRMQKGTQQLQNQASLRTTRRDIARAKTILAQKKAEQAQPAGQSSAGRASKRNEGAAK